MGGWIFLIWILPAGLGGPSLGLKSLPQKVGEKHGHAVKIRPQGKGVTLYGGTDHMNESVGN